MIEFINLYLIPGLIIGSIYALGAVGISMIFGILRFAHFAHGDLMTIGAYGTLTAVWFIPVHPLLLLPCLQSAPRCLQQRLTHLRGEKVLIHKSYVRSRNVQTDLRSDAGHARLLR